MSRFFCETKLSEKISKTPEGFLVCHDVPIMVSGDMYYSKDQVGSDINSKNGHVRVSKPIENIHSDETIRSFEGKPITLGHPKDSEGNGVFVTPENSKGLIYGSLQNVRAGSGKNHNLLMTDFVITDKDAIDLVESGDLREVSCGYDYEAANIQEGFFEQTNIRGNHVALVPRGRAGPQCAIFDSKEEVKSMSLKDKLKEAIGVFSKAIDEAVPDEVKGEMATRVKPKASDESPMMQANEDMAVMSLDSRMYNLEYMVADLVAKLKDVVFDKVVTAMASDESEEEKDAPEEIKVADESSEEKPEEDSEEKAEVEVEVEKALDSDTISKAEILAPGIVKSGGNIKRRALDECYKTEDGKGVIDSILSGKSFDDSDNDLLFSATASILSSNRSNSIRASSAFDSSRKGVDNRSKVDIFNENQAKMHARLSRGEI